MDGHFSAAVPGRGHLALASFYRTGKAPAVITQNIDNLHQSSGISEEHVIELHGNNSYALCLDCAKRFELSWVRQRFTDANERAPDCPDCGTSNVRRQLSVFAAHGTAEQPSFGGPSGGGCCGGSCGCGH